MTRPEKRNRVPAPLASVTPFVAAFIAAFGFFFVVRERPSREVPPPPLPPPEVAWAPAEPVQGHLFLIRVAVPPGLGMVSAEGEAGGEELHFVRVASAEALVASFESPSASADSPARFAYSPAPSADSPAALDSIFESLAPVPINATGTIEAWVRATYADGRTRTDSLRIPVVAGEYEHERLRVAPRFGSPPNEEDQARLQRERERAAQVPRDARVTPRLWTANVVMPRDARVTSEFGTGREYNGRISSRHMGLDLAGARGDTVVAAADGIVALVDSFLLAGNIVYLNHGGGLLSSYSHLSEQLVAEGEWVSAGTPIGRVGATGRVTGPHLHWVVRYGNTTVDPRSLLALVR